jgi:hypothetical protein
MSTGIQVSDIDITFFYPFYKYLWISNVTRICTRGYKLISKFMPNKFFTHGHTRIMNIHCDLYPHGG